MAEPLTPGQAEALLLAKTLMDSGELPAGIYDALAAWTCRLLGMQHRNDVEKLMTKWQAQHSEVSDIGYRT